MWMSTQNAALCVRLAARVSSANIAYCSPDDSIQRFRYCGGNDTPAKTDGIASLTA
jgi:hypothetical protein